MSDLPAVNLTLSLLALNTLAVLWLFSIKFREKLAYRRSLAAVKGIMPILESMDMSALQLRSPRELVEALEKASARFELSREAREAAAARVEPFLSRYARTLRSPARDRRMLAVYLVRFLHPETAVPLLRRAITAEKSSAVLLRAADSAVYLRAADLVPLLLDTVAGRPDIYAFRLAAALEPLGDALETAFSERPVASREEKLFFIQAARKRPCVVFGEYLRGLIGFSDGNPGMRTDLAREAARVLADTRPSVLNSRFCLAHPDPEIRSIAIQSLGGIDSPDTVKRLFSFLPDPTSRKPALTALRALALKRPEHIKAVLRRFYQEPDPEIRTSLAQVLHDRLDYFLYSLRSTRGSAVLRLVSILLEAGHCYGLASFLNRNRDPALEEAILPTVRAMLEQHPSLAVPLAESLRTEVREKLDLPAPLVPERDRRPTAKPADRPLLAAALIVLVILPVAASFLFQALSPGMSPGAAVRSFLTAYSQAFAYYGLAINAVSLVFLWFSIRELRYQINAKRSRSPGMVFRDGMLPPISVIVPAFREEKSIVQSVRALLGLKYPDYEVIVINDGSPDRTLDVLVESFGLERAESRGTGDIGTAPVIGWYRNPSLPRLLVIDKVNGGKADALNAGINAARGDYFCGIDADSILEKEALLRAAVVVLDSDNEFVAAGGNILPANGCEIRDGDLASIHIPRAALALFQTVEYLRAFLVGRLGWARLRGMLIISGAFGLFSRRRVMEAGGYMTRQSSLGRDTVGEDMELVVRLVRRMRERRLPYTVSYAFDANCWTEVPEDAGSLYRQRDRWQRGLLEIIAYHRRMILNLRYGRVGLYSILHYLAFETLGPFYEIIGLAIGIVSISLGLLDTGQIMLLLCGTVLSGILVSTISLAVAERQVLYFSVPETWKLLGFAVLENLGYRQWSSWIRAWAYLGFLWGRGGWGAQKRKGFFTREIREERAPAASG